VLEIIKGFGGLFAVAAYTGGRSTVPTVNEKALLDATFNLKMSEALVRGELDATKALELRSLANPEAVNPPPISTAPPSTVHCVATALDAFIRLKLRTT
jgi:hypothetical protein